MADRTLQQLLDASPSRSERRQREEQLHRTMAYPRSAWRRWLMRLVFTVPGLLTVALASTIPPLVDSPNVALLARLETIDWGRADSLWLTELYPHVSTLIGSANPFGRVGLGVLGVIAAGVLLQKVVEILAQRAVTVPLGTALMVALAANPLFFYFATENLPGFLALCFFGMALADLVRFVNWGNTASGFRAGLLIMLAALSDPTGLLYAAVAVMASPFLRHGRFRTPGLRAANMLVIAFPTGGAFVTLAMLNIAFFGIVWPLDLTAVWQSIPERWDELAGRYGTPFGWVNIAPLVSAWLVALIVRRPLAILVSTLVYALIIGAFVLGLIAPGAAGVTYILLTLLAITLLPTGRTMAQNALVTGIAVAQLGIAWTVALDRPVVVEWMLGLVAAAGSLNG